MAEKNKVVIVIQDGVLNNVYSVEPLDIELIDYDAINADEHESENDLDKALAEAETIAVNAEKTMVNNSF